MSDDWAKKYVASYRREQEEKRRKEEDERRQRGYAEARGPEKFQRIRERIEQDVQVLRDALLFQPAQVHLSADGAVTVDLNEEPQAQLTLRLVDLRLIQYEYRFSRKPGSQTIQLHIGQKLKALRICSDLDAILTVHDDESERVFSDDADISEFLLTPMLNYLKT